MAAKIEFQNITLRFGRKKALRNLSFSIPAGSTAAFVGANGAGKTTAFSLLGGLLPRYSGTVRIDGVRLEKYRSKGGIIGLLPQEGEFFDGSSIESQLRLCANMSGCFGRAAEREVALALDRAALQERRKQEPETLSRGMKLRLSMAQALMCNPPVVLFDEPMAGLDPDMLRQFRNLVEQIRGQTTLVISSHDLHELQEMSDYCCMIHEGALLQQGAMKEVLSGVSRVTYKVSAIPQELEGLSRKLPDVQFHSQGAETLIAEFDPAAREVKNINGQVLGWLLENNVSVLAVAGDQSLEETYFKAVGKDKKKE